MKATCSIIISAAYSIIGKELMEVGILKEEDWSLSDDLDGADSEDLLMIKIWESLIKQLWNSDIRKMRSEAAKINTAMQKVPEFNSPANVILVGLHLLNYWADNCANFIDKARWAPKLKRTIPAITRRVAEVNPELAATSYAAADNLFRELTGKVLISKEIRQAKSKYIMNKLKNRRGI